MGFGSQRYSIVNLGVSGDYLVLIDPCVVQGLGYHRVDKKLGTGGVGSTQVRHGQCSCVVAQFVRELILDAAFA